MFRFKPYRLAFILAIGSAILRFLAFTQTPFANGWDSYFYLVQIKSLEETGQMHSPEASLIYPYLRIFYWMTGDYVLGMKIGIAVLCGFFTLLLCRKIQTWPLLGAWSLFSPQLTYFAAQYPKNLLGLLLFLAFVRVLDWAVSKRPVWLMLPALLLIVNYFGHRMMFGMAVAYLFLWLGFRWNCIPELCSGTRFRKIISAVFCAHSPRNRVPGYLPWRLWCFHQAPLAQDTPGKDKTKRWRSSVVLKIALTLGIVIGAFTIASQFFPGLANAADLGRLDGILSWKPQFAPWSFVQTFGVERIGGWWIFEIAMVTVWWVLGWRIWKGVSNPALFWLCSLLLFPFLEWSLTGLAWRMFLVFVLLLPLAFDFQPISKKASPIAFLLICTAALFSWKSYSPVLHDPDYALFKKVTGNIQTQLPESSKLSGSSLPNNPELFIAHNALAEYVTFTTGTDAMPWLPEYAIDSLRLWRIAAGMRGQTLRYFAGPDNTVKIKSLGGGYFLLPEYVWQFALKNAHAENDAYFLETAESWLNPYRIRPAFLLKKKQ